MKAVLRAFALASALAMPAAAENPSGAPADWPQPEHGSLLAWLVEFDQLEYAFFDRDDAVRWEAAGWVGGDTTKLWLESSGAWATTGARGGEAELQALVGRTLTPWWDVRAGVRQEWFVSRGPNRERTSAVVDLDGVAPLGFSVAPSLLFDQHRNVTGELLVTNDVRITQRLHAQPRFELIAATRDVEELGIRRGLTDLELGLRVRYEIRPELAPYVGVHWERVLGPSAIVARRGGHASAVAAVVGLRFWY